MTGTRKAASAKRAAAPASGRRRLFNYPRAGRGRIHRWVPSWRFVLTSVLFVGAVGVGALVTAYARTEIPEASAFALAQTTTVYYSDGTTEMGKFVENNREIIADDVIPDVVKDAVVAAEDRTFWENAGVDVKGMARALWVNVTTGKRQGGSTITQQYAERYLGDETVTDYVGKLKEALLSLKLGQQADKDEILSGYINTIYFGRGAYGIQTAAQAYFGVDAKDLTTAQAVLLAGIIPSPTNFDPRTSETNAERRFDYVRDSMVLTGALTQAEADKLKMPKTIEVKRSNSLAGPRGYLLDMVRREVVAAGLTTDEEIGAVGLKIITTIDRKDQAALQETIQKEGLLEGSSKNLRAAAVALDASTGAIRALYAGEDYTKVQQNRVTQDRAQAGSTFKPFTLVAALEAGHTLDDRFNGNSGRRFDGIKDPVRNFGGTNWGNISLLRATENSVNTPFVELNLELTPEVTNAVAVRAGIPTDTPDLKDVPSSVLGVAAVHPIDMAESYGTLASGGLHNDPFIVDSVRRIGGDSDIYRGAKAPERVIEADVVNETTYALTQVVQHGSGTTAKQLGRPVAGKTGTSNDNRSAWFVGYTPQVVTAVALYQSGDDGSQQSIDTFRGYREITGGTAPLDIWTSYMTKALDGVPVVDFPARAVPERPTPTDTPSVEPTDEPSETPSDEPTTPQAAAVPGGIVGVKEETARRLLSRAGLEAVVIYREDANIPKGLVIESQPGEGTEVPPGSSITIVVSSGPPATPDPTPTDDPTEPEPPDPTTEPAQDPTTQPADAQGGEGREP
ncbi:penicillin-binding protein [Sanguibacter sp. HDW7]|uniref:penicillin-binding protein n=1 Tax=Sanguibacter sp. HDW7 TaxID=2714931 RepID=UPI00140B1E26|nr:penicillin-binding protein [Sanguibacter sp. HDW7]QIK84727.1 PASTA domain-containing protein [Sanguibacter sp. HDW7]